MNEPDKLTLEITTLELIHELHHRSLINAATGGEWSLPEDITDSPELMERLIGAFCALLAAITIDCPGYICRLLDEIETQVKHDLDDITRNN